LEYHIYGFTVSQSKYHQNIIKISEQKLKRQNNEYLMDVEIVEIPFLLQIPHP